MVIKFVNGKIKVIPDYDEMPTTYASIKVHQKEVQQEVQPPKRERKSKTKEERNKEYYDKHKLDYYSFPYECECGTIITKVHLNRHRESAKHHMLLELKNINETN